MRSSSPISTISWSNPSSSQFSTLNTIMVQRSSDWWVVELQSIHGRGFELTVFGYSVQRRAFSWSKFDENIDLKTVLHHCEINLTSLIIMLIISDRYQRFSCQTNQFNVTDYYADNQWQFNASWKFQRERKQSSWQKSNFWNKPPRCWKNKPKSRHQNTNFWNNEWAG